MQDTMTRIIWFLSLSVALYGCGTDSEDSSSAADADNDDAFWVEDDLDDVETGSLTIKLPEERSSGEGLCSLNITRIPEERLASLILTLDVIGEGCDVAGYCDNPDMRNGQLTYSGGIDGDNEFATMVLNYEPPGDPEEEVMWMYNAIFKTEPFSRFEMSVDGEAFNVLTSDTRGAEDFSAGPHIWNTKIVIEADMLRSSEADSQTEPGLQTRGEISYEGLCEVSAKYMRP